MIDAIYFGGACYICKENYERRDIRNIKDTDYKIPYNICINCSKLGKKVSSQELKNQYDNNMCIKTIYILKCDKCNQTKTINILSLRDINIFDKKQLKCNCK